MMEAWTIWFAGMFVWLLVAGFFVVIGKTTEGFLALIVAFLILQIGLDHDYYEAVEEALRRITIRQGGKEGE